MKAIKKLLSIVMVLTLVLSLGASALAAEGTMSEAKKTTITVTETNPNDTSSTYYAYQLFTAEQKADDSAGNDIFEYHINDTFKDAIAAGLTAGPESVTDRLGNVLPRPNVSEENKVLEYLSCLTADEIRAFANAAYEQILGKGTSASYTAVGKVFSGVPQGYYLISETVGTGNNTVTSLVMLDTAGEDAITVTTKENVPSSWKKVKDINDSTETNKSDWQDSADWDIGDVIDFQLNGKLPTDYARYDKGYYLAFHDQECAGLTFDPSSVKVYVDGKQITTGFEVVTSGLTDDCKFEVVFANVKTITEAHADSVITVEYTSTLNENAVIGSGGNPNTMHMEFTNDSYQNQFGDHTGTTPDDTVIVFTYQMDTNKVNGIGEALEGAEFTLYKWDAATNDWVAHAMTMAESKTEFYFKGLDDGFYKLEETKVPDGYNKADDIYFTVTAEHDVDSADPKLTKLEVTLTDKDKTPLAADKQEGAFTVNVTSGHIGNTVVNLTGLELPSTGGIGTTIFYVIGAVLVAAAVVLLVTKKRVNGAEK